MDKLNFYPYYEKLLRLKVKTTTFRLIKPKSKPNEQVMITVGWDKGKRRPLYLASVTTVYRKRIKNLTKQDFAGESPDCQTREATALVLSCIYRRRLTLQSKIWVVKFVHLKARPRVAQPSIPDVCERAEPRPQKT